MEMKNPDKRKNFRISMNVPVLVYRWKDQEVQTPEDCILVDISVGGACVNSESRYTKDEILCLRVKLEEDEAMSLLGQIIRTTEAECGSYRYGILFAEVWDEERLHLDHILNRMRIHLIPKKSHSENE